tara:strand:+ start:1032 stop:1376 length:345 start_codon:yes stop_codon:yes gene_type:complete
MKRIEKPWGYEELIEHNEKYVLKRLFMKKDNRCSLQYHDYKHETLYVVTGLLKLTVGTSMETLDTVELHPGDSYVLTPKTIHRMEGLVDTLYLESSTPELEDVVRLEDDYGRSH